MELSNFYAILHILHIINNIEFIILGMGIISSHIDTKKCLILTQIFVEMIGCDNCQVPG